MNIQKLPLEMIEHILNYSSFEDKLNLASLQDDVLNKALGKELVLFYQHVYRFLPCGRWFNPKDNKSYIIMLLPELFGLHVDFWTDSNRKRMCFNKLNGIRLVRRCMKLKLNINGEKIDEEDKVYHEEVVVRRVASAVLMTQNEFVYVFRFNMLSETMDVFQFLKGKKLVCKKKIIRKHVPKAWKYFFYFGCTVRLQKLKRFIRHEDDFFTKMCNQASDVD